VAVVVVVEAAEAVVQSEKTETVVVVVEAAEAVVQSKKTERHSAMKTRPTHSQPCR